jgi:hypothetical protein
MSHQHRHTNTHAPHTAPLESKVGAAGPEACGEQPTADRIRLRAYEIFQSRKGGQGDPLADWMQAEQELKASKQFKR